jgi:hypothetical protein
MRHRFTVRCMLCGRTAGLVHEGVFRRQADAPPLAARAGRSACGYCRGSLFLEPDDTAGAFPVAEFPQVQGGRRAAPQRTAGRRAS